MKITWLVDGKVVPSVGKSKIGVTIPCPDDIAKNLIKQKVAKEAKEVKPKVEPKEEKGGSN
jgi:hypothetical protein